jgi:molecular chaperone GrpE
MEENIDEKVEAIEPEEIVDDIVYDESESVADIVKKLKDKIKVLQKEKEEYLNNWQRERADFVNFKKEEDVRMTRVRGMVKENILESLLPVLDSFSVAFSNKAVWEKVDENWRKGIEYIHQQFSQVLLENGITEIDPKYLDEFDPNLHQSIEDRETDKEEERHKIIQVVQKGYKVGESVVRPARVVTGK